MRTIEPREDAGQSNTQETEQTEPPVSSYSRGWEDGCADCEVLCLPDSEGTNTTKAGEHDRIRAKLEAAQLACQLALQPSSALPGCVAPIDEADIEYASGYSEGFEALTGALARERAAASLTRCHNVSPEGSADEHQERAGSIEHGGHDTRG